MHANDTAVIKTELKALRKNVNSLKVASKNFATKDDLKGFATKDDLKGFATKDDLKGFATKDDLKDFPRKGDPKGFATKDDLKDFPRQGDPKGFATKDDLKAFVTNERFDALVEIVVKNSHDIAEMKPVLFSLRDDFGRFLTRMDDFSRVMLRGQRNDEVHLQYIKELRFTANDHEKRITSLESQ